MFQFRSFVISHTTVAFIVFATVCAVVASNPPASARDSRPVITPSPRIAIDAPTFYAARESNHGAQRARLDAVIITSALQGGIVPGCPIIGGWEDGTVIGHCAESDTFISRGQPGSDWYPYVGPITDRMAGRMACLDGRVSEYDCQHDTLLQSELHAGTMRYGVKPME